MMHHRIPRRLFIFLSLPFVACVVFLASLLSARAEVVVRPIPVARPSESFPVVRDAEPRAGDALMAQSFRARARGSVTDPGAIEAQLVRDRADIETRGYVILPEWTRETSYRNEHDLVLEREWWTVPKSAMGFAPQEMVGTHFNTAGVSASKGVLNIQAISHDPAEHFQLDPAILARITGKPLNEAKTYLESVCGCTVTDIRVFSLNKEKIPPLATQISVSIDT